jgi:hypothetical protein
MSSSRVRWPAACPAAPFFLIDVSRLGLKDVFFPKKGFSAMSVLNPVPEHSLSAMTASPSS